MASVNVLSNDIRGKIKKEVPFISGAFVTFFDDVTVEVITKAQSARNSEDILKNLDVVIAQIVEWNFSDGEGNILPLTTESLTKIPMKLLKWINETEAELINSPAIKEEKKN